MARKPTIPPKKQVLRLKDNHTWNAPKGYKIVVLDRGAVSFNVPEKWVLVGMEPVTLHDVQPPDDNVRLSVSFWHLPPGVDWSGLPLAPMLTDALKDSDLEIIERSDLTTIPRDDLEIVWTEHRFIDPQEKREAFSRITIARGWNVQALLTMDYWVNDRSKFLPAWHEVIRSLQLGRVIADPTKGVPVQ